ncbi:hypothetical protein T439DRAFT_378804 [Meredithblackwellia eburnea MCA 4105]
MATKLSEHHSQATRTDSTTTTRNQGQPLTVSNLATLTTNSGTRHPSVNLYLAQQSTQLYKPEQLKPSSSPLVPNNISNLVKPPSYDRILERLSTLNSLDGPSATIPADTALVLLNQPVLTESRKPAVPTTDQQQLPPSSPKKKRKLSLVSQMRPRTSSSSLNRNNTVTNQPPRQSSNDENMAGRGGGAAIRNGAGTEGKEKEKAKAREERRPTLSSPLLQARQAVVVPHPILEEMEESDEESTSPKLTMAEKGKGKAVQRGSLSDEKKKKKKSGEKVQPRSEFDSDEEREHAERLEARRLRRKAKAVIVKDTTQTAAKRGAAAAAKVKKNAASRDTNDKAKGKKGKKKLKKEEQISESDDSEEEDEDDDEVASDRAPKRRKASTAETNRLLQSSKRASNVTEKRLTVRPSTKLGLFHKGVASVRTKIGQPVPDLAFSELPFLNSTRPSPPPRQSSKKRSTTTRKLSQDEGDSASEDTPSEIDSYSTSSSSHEARPLKTNSKHKKQRHSQPERTIAVTATYGSKSRKSTSAAPLKQRQVSDFFQSGNGVSSFGKRDKSKAKRDEPSRRQEVRGSKKGEKESTQEGRKRRKLETSAKKPQVKDAPSERTETVEKERSLEIRSPSSPGSRPSDHSAYSNAQRDSRVESASASALAPLDVQVLDTTALWPQPEIVVNSEGLVGKKTVVIDSVTSPLPPSAPRTGHESSFTAHAASSMDRIIRDAFSAVDHVQDDSLAPQPTPGELNFSMSVSPLPSADRLRGRKVEWHSSDGHDHGFGAEVDRDATTAEAGGTLDDPYQPEWVTREEGIHEANSSFRLTNFSDVSLRPQSRNASQWSRRDDFGQQQSIELGDSEPDAWRDDNWRGASLIGEESLVGVGVDFEFLGDGVESEVDELDLASPRITTTVPRFPSQVGLTSEAAGGQWANRPGMAPEVGDPNFLDEMMRSHWYRAQP